jgi:hypothetical protein
MNKTIYMTYKKEIPEKVTDRWKQLNPSYAIDFSLDHDCIQFLREHFNDYIANLFISIPVGMYKADLWRLCKLYVYGGVYADVDLVPYINLNLLDSSVDFYSCISAHNDSIFQAFMLSKPKHPLLYVFLLSFLLNNPYNQFNGPTYDMYYCLQYMINQRISPHKKYMFDVKIKINIGSSPTKIKQIPLYYFPKFSSITIKLHPHSFSDKFTFFIQNNTLTVTRIDSPTGWDHSHSIDIGFKTNATIMLFQEHWGVNNQHMDCYVTHYRTKILNSRDKDFINHEWVSTF